MLKLGSFTVVVICAIGLAACGGSDGGSSSSSSTGTTAGDVSPAVQADIDQAYEGSFGEPPKTSPNPKSGENIWFIPISSETYDYRKPGSLYEAAAKIGWNITQFDGKYSPDTIVSGVRQAIAAKADGIILYIVDCPNVKAGLEEAKRAGIPVVAAQGFDCDEVKPGEPSLFDATVHYRGEKDPTKPMPFPEFIRDEWGRTQALAAINGTGGQAKIIDVYESDLLVTVEQDKGLRAELKRACPGCEIVETVEFQGSEVGAPLQQKVEQALISNPDANSVISPYDAITEVIAPAVRSSGRASSIYTVGDEGAANVMDDIREGGRGVNAAVGLAPDWELYAMLDAMNRLLAGEEQTDGFPTGLGTQIIDKTHNLPPNKGERYVPPIDFRSTYEAAWGL